MNLNLAKFQDDVAVTIKAIETSTIVEAATKAAEAIAARAYPGDPSDGSTRREGVAKDGPKGKPLLYLKIIMPEKLTKEKQL